MIGNLPNQLFRFRPLNRPYWREELRRALRQEIFLPLSSALNDPYDLRPAIEEPSAGAVYKQLKSRFGNKPMMTFDRMEELEGRRLSKVERKRAKREFAPSYKLAQVEKGTFQKLFGSLPMQTCIACFSERKESPLMWAHYAGNHAGLCIEFLISTDRVLSADADLAPVRVKYDERRPLLSYAEGLEFSQRGGKMEQEEALSVFQKLYATKGLDWSYEREWRIIVLAEHGQRYRTCQYLEPSCIYTGIRTTDEHVAEIGKIVGDRVPVRKVQMNSSNFDLIAS